METPSKQQHADQSSFVRTLEISEQSAAVKQMPTHGANKSTFKMVKKKGCIVAHPCLIASLVQPSQSGEKSPDS